MGLTRFLNVSDPQTWSQVFLERKSYRLNAQDNGNGRWNSETAPWFRSQQMSELVSIACLFVMHYILFSLISHALFFVRILSTMTSGFLLMAFATLWTTWRPDQQTQVRQFSVAACCSRWRKLKKSEEMVIGGLEHDFYFPIYWECHHPNWLIFFRAVETTNQ